MGKKKVIAKTEEEVIREKDTLEAAMSKAMRDDKTAKKKIESGKVYISASYNNTIVSVANKEGDVIAWASAGSLGFSGPKKATPFAASKVVAAIAEKIKKTGLSNISIIVKGVGSGRDSAIRSLASHGFNILSISDMTPVPHNGPRPPKVRRV